VHHFWACTLFDIYRDRYKPVLSPPLVQNRLVFAGSTGTAKTAQRSALSAKP